MTEPIQGSNGERKINVRLLRERILASESVPMDVRFEPNFE